MSTTHSPRSTQVAVDDLEYRPLCVTAVVGLVLAIVSLFAFAHQVLWALPAGAVVLNMIALRQISRHQPELVGRRAATIGLLLGIIIAIAAPTREYVIAARSRNEARILARYWIEAVCSHDLQQAANFMVNVSAERLTGRDEPTNEDEEYVRRRHGPAPAVLVVQALEQTPPPVKIHYLGSDEIEQSMTRERINSVWEVSGVHDGTPVKHMIKLSLDRARKSPRRIREWHVNSASLIDELPAGFKP